MKAIFQELYDRYHRDLYQFIYYMVKNRSTAEDLVQEVYIKVLKSYETFKGESSPKTWMFSIARHVTIDFFRKEERRKKRSADQYDIHEHQEALKDHQPLPDEIAEQNERIQLLYRCLDDCTEDQRLVIILRYIQELSIQETAEALDWTISKVKTTQHRAVKFLTKRMNELEGGIADE